MEREIFVHQIAVQKETIEEANEEIKRLKNLYLETNCPFKIGDKISITRNPEYTLFDRLGASYNEQGFITKIEVSDKGIFHYFCDKVKKDGTKHSHQLYTFSGFNNEKCILTKVD